MGTYTEISLGVELKKDAPQYVIDVLNQMVNGHEPITSHPDHKFFNQCDRWQYLFRMDSYYFSWQTHWSFEKDHISGTYYLSGVSNLKNYSNEISHFMSWINPFLHNSCAGVIGWTQYEEQMSPDLIARRCFDSASEDYVITFVRTEDLVEAATRPKENAA